MRPRNLPDLFASAATCAKPHIAFERLRDSEHHADARSMMNDLASRMHDPDGRFVADFQGEAFHARLFELSCFAYLDAQGLFVDRSLPRPDFLALRDGSPVCAIETTTTNSSEPSGQRTDIAVCALEEESLPDLLEKSEQDFPFRVGRALTKKLHERYWEEPRCRDLPLVLAIGPFHEPGSTQYVDENLVAFLYGIDRWSDWTKVGSLYVRETRVERHEFHGRSIRSNFFASAGAEHVSAVLYSNQWTVPRFMRLAAQARQWDGLAGDRTGDCLLPGRENEYFSYEIALGSEETPAESWWQGVTIFENPRARMPLPRGALRCTSKFSERDGRIVREVTDFHPLNSIMRYWRSDERSQSAAHAGPSP